MRHADRWQPDTNDTEYQPLHKLWKYVDHGLIITAIVVLTGVGYLIIRQL